MFDLERPFHRLIHHYVTRIFHGAGEGDDLQFSIPALLGLLSVPSAFGSILLLDKYSTLRMFFMGVRYFDVYRASFFDEYFFIVYSMVITGSVVVLKWDRLFPDRQDYDNLAILPISGRQNFAASLIALLFLTSLFAAIVNGAASVIFPYAVTNSYDSLPVLAEFFVAHLSAVVLASFFTCFGLLAVMGMTIMIVPKRFVRVASLVVRITCVLGLAAMLASVFAMPGILQAARLPAYVYYVPSVWFLDLHQTLLINGTVQTGTGIFAVEITAVLFVLAIAVYALTYYREYMRIPERSGLISTSGSDTQFLRRVLEPWALRTPFQSATYVFAIKTLFRNEKHCLLFGTATAMGFFVAAQTSGQALATPVNSGIDPRLLSVSLTLAFFTIVSLRALLDVPSDRQASWVFRSTVDRHRHEARSVAGKVLVSPVIVWLGIALPLHVMLWGWRMALLHCGYVLMCSIGLSQLLLIRYRKIPFTCSYTASKDKILVMIILGLVGFGLFSEANARFEASLLSNTWRYLVFVACFAVLLWRIHVFQDGLTPEERALIYEHRPVPMVQILNITR
jgi:hypothetical protein